MTSLLPLLLCVIFIACFACLYTEGMWGNAIRLINVVTAALLATNFFEPLADWMEGMADTFTYVWDFLALWGLFAVFMVVFRLITDRVSRVKVRFLKIADQIGSGLLAAWVGWVVVCFTLMTLHTAPLARNFMFEAFEPEEKMFWGLAPDRKWLGFMQKMSLGAFARSETVPEKNEKYAFDPQGEFMPKYATRRAKLGVHVDKEKTIRVRR